MRVMIEKELKFETKELEEQPSIRVADSAPPEQTNAGDDWGNYSNRGLVYLAMNDYDKAVADFNIAVQRAPERPGPLRNRANAYEAQGKFKEAIADLEKVLEKDPTYESARKKLIELRKKLYS